jgi:DNA-binding NarL/FixJ family response regulator
VTVVLSNEIASTRAARNPENGNGVAPLDARELEVLRLLSLGLTNRQIAGEIYYSVGTVKNIVRQVTEKLGVSDRNQAADAVRTYLGNGSTANH